LLLERSSVLIALSIGSYLIYAVLPLKKSHLSLGT
jgi:hypothetical protein